MKDYSDYTNRALFIHISKTGGASIAKVPFILKYGSPNIAPTSKFIKSLCFRFSFVRNPYTRIASAILNHDYATPATFNRFVTEELESNIKNDDQHFRPQYDLLYFNGKLEVDFVGRFENLLLDWDKVCKKMNDYYELPHVNKGRYKNYYKYYQLYNPAAREVIKKLYRKDFEVFGY